MENIDENAISLKEYIDLRFEYNDDAIKLQAVEYARRLDQLNHDHQRTKETQQTYLPREIYEQSQKDIIKNIADLREYKSNMEGRFWVMGVVVTFMSIIVNILLKWFFK